MDDATFERASFWVQIHNLPFQRMNKATAEAIGRTFGTVEQVDASPTGQCHDHYLRVRIHLDINQPLCRGRMVNAGEMEPQWVSLQYERLPFFRYWCGHLNHGGKDCSLWIDSRSTLNTDEQQYGAWLRASTNSLQQPQVVNCSTKPNFNPPRGPPRPPCPMPSPTTEQASETTTCTETPFPKSTPTIWLPLQTQSLLRYTLQLTRKFWRIQIFSARISRRLTMFEKVFRHITVNHST